MPVYLKYKLNEHVIYEKINIRGYYETKGDSIFLRYQRDSTNSGLINYKGWGRIKPFGILDICIKDDYGFIPSCDKMKLKFRKAKKVLIQ